MAYDTLNELMDHLRNVTNLTVSAWNCKYRATDCDGCGPVPENRFCQLIHSCDKALTACINSDVDAFRAADEQGGLYCYTCPFGLLEAVMPISYEGQTVGYVMIGKAIPDEPGAEERILTNLVDRFPELKKKQEELRACLKQFTRFSVAQWEGCLCTLYVYAKYIEEQRLLFQQTKTLGQLAREYINANYGSKITVTDLCLRLHCSTVTLTHHFRREFGTSIAGYLKGKRLSRAEYLLVHTRMNINEISESCGFSDANYFFRQFKSRYHVSPTQYRKLHGEEKSK